MTVLRVKSRKEQVNSQPCHSERQNGVTERQTQLPEVTLEQVTPQVVTSGHSSDTRHQVIMPSQNTTSSSISSSSKVTTMSRPQHLTLLWLTLVTLLAMTFTMDLADATDGEYRLWHMIIVLLLNDWMTNHSSDCHLQNYKL